MQESFDIYSIIIATSNDRTLLSFLLNLRGLLLRLLLLL